MANLNVLNRTLFHQDNLPVLQGINSNSIDLVATDPPFQKGRTFHADIDSLSAGATFQDRWQWTAEHQGWSDLAVNKGYPAVADAIRLARSCHSDDMGAYLSFLAVRLVECHRVLKATGTMLIHCDYTANAYIRILIDSIFGADKFRNTIIWAYGKMSNNQQNFARNHDTILRYTKTDDYRFHQLKKEDSEYRTRYSKHLTADNKILYGDMKDSKDKLIALRASKVSKQLDRPLQDNDVLFDFNVEYKHQDDVFYISHLKGNSSERTGYPTQKPVALYERLILACSNTDDVVLDPFTGSATTCIAAERLGRQWVGIDLWADAYKVVLKRFVDEGFAVPNTSNNKLTFDDIHYRQDVPVRTDLKEGGRT